MVWSMHLNVSKTGGDLGDGDGYTTSKGYPLGEKGPHPILPQAFVDLEGSEKGRCLMVKVKDIMTKNPVIIEANKTVREAINILSEKRIGSLMVCKGDDIVGLLEEGDVVRNALAKDLNFYVTKVEEVMSAPFIINEDQSDNDASDMMLEHHVRHLAVSENSKIIGIVSMYDLLRPIYTGKSFWT
jgi:CBS domain-containing protein